MQLVIGNKTYSSWSLRAWLAVRQTGTAFTERLLPLDTPEFAAAIKDISPAGRVPVLIDGETKVWDSLAIIEYLAERFPGAGLWPQERAARALARSVVAEMHSGFGALRSNFPMNLRRRPAPHPQAPDASSDIARIGAIWRDCRDRNGADGAFLFGVFSAADCFYAPVVTRFLTYQLPMDTTMRAYAEAVMDHSFMVDWRRGAAEESWVVGADEVD